MNLAPFSFWADWSVKAVLKMSASLFKSILHFRVVFSYFQGQKKLNNRVSIHCKVHTKNIN